MPVSYNLRSSCRKKDVSVSQCYLHKYLNKSPEFFHPEVRLERLKLLECHNIQNSRFYIEKGRITIKKNKSFLWKKIYVLKIICTVIIIAASLLFWKLNAPLKREPHDENIKSISAIPEEEFTQTHYDLEIRKFVREYFQELKKKNKIGFSIKSSKSFIEDQCKSNTKDKVKVSSVKKNFDQVRCQSELANFTDYALESQGAKIVSIFNTELYGTITVKFLNFNLWPEVSKFLLKYLKSFNSNGPNSILIPWKKPGDCWAFKGSLGRVQIELSQKIIVTAITIDHIPKEVVPHGSFQSAPKKFTITGVEKCKNQICKTDLGSYEYKSKGPATQTFFICPSVKIPFEMIEVHILSNHGNKEYTCVYKIQVHGY